ncbi:MAG TPA: hypothetical protein ENI62_15855 [Gammaproteobacteria bacterium]|nr:hypothetical protein [Gammaproteobacteria bacterium]
MTSYYMLLCGKYRYGLLSGTTRTSAKLRLFLATGILLAGMIFVPWQVQAVQIPVYQPFLGHYKGHALLVDGDKKQQRDLAVTISAVDDGFRLQWQTVAYYNNKVKTKNYSIAFKASGRANIYRSAMKKDLFGAPQPLDPMKGEPYIWARFKNNTMTVYALMITDDGGYEFQIYDRTLTNDGIQLTFRRIRNNNILKKISAHLLRQK